MAKRYRKPSTKDGELLVKYGKDSGGEDLFYCWPANECGMKRDTKLLMHAFERIAIFHGNPLVKELESRGYDIKTLVFSIKKKQPEQIAAEFEPPAEGDGYEKQNHQVRLCHL